MAGNKRGAEDPASAPDIKRAMLAKALEAVKTKARNAVGRAQAVAQGMPQPLLAAPVVSAGHSVAAPTPSTMSLHQSVQARLAKMRQHGVLPGTASPLPPSHLGMQQQQQQQQQRKLVPDAVASPSERLRLLKERVEGKIETINTRPPASQNVTMTADGRFIDATTGEEVEVKKREAVSLVNKRHAGGTDTPVVEKEVVPEKEDDTDQMVVDPSIKTLKNASRRPRNINFHERGFHMDYARRLRKRAELDHLKQEIEQRSAKVQLDQGGVSSTLLLTAKPNFKARGVPTIEWWDNMLLPTINTMENVENITEIPAITNLIEHPILIQQHKPHSTRNIPVMRTRKELKKESRVRRREEHEEKQERIRLNLEPAPPPKLRLSNLMRLLADETVQDPTKMEAEVRRQVSERKEKHEKANDDRKLTKEQRREKRDKKLIEDTKYEVHTAAFWVKDLSSKLNKAKVDTNAVQYKLTGAVVMCPGGNLVVVEGGPRNVAKYTRLMMHRIKWNLKTRNEDDDDYEMNDYDEDEEDEDTLGTTKLVDVVWKGTTKTRRFTKWVVRKCSNDDDARRWLREYDAENMWDLVISTAAQVAQDE